MNPEILDKLKELQLLIEKEKNPHGQTMVDFFKPTASKIIQTLKWRILNNLRHGMITTDQLKADEQYLEDVVIASFNSVNAEMLLEFASGVYEDSDWMEQVKKHIKKGEKLQAVKIYKTNTSCGLKESKDYIDMLTEKMNYS